MNRHNKNMGPLNQACVLGAARYWKAGRSVHPEQVVTVSVGIGASDSLIENILPVSDLVPMCAGPGASISPGPPEGMRVLEDRFGPEPLSGHEIRRPGPLLGILKVRSLSHRISRRRTTRHGSSESEVIFGGVFGGRRPSEVAHRSIFAGREKSSGRGIEPRGGVPENKQRPPLFERLSGAPVVSGGGAVLRSGRGMGVQRDFRRTRCLPGGGSDNSDWPTRRVR